MNGGLVKSDFRLAPISVLGIVIEALDELQGVNDYLQAELDITWASTSSLLKGAP